MNGQGGMKGIAECEELGDIDSTHREDDHH